MKRYAIYFFYDKDGIVDKYVIYFLENLKPYIQYLLFISGVRLGEKEKKKLTNIAEKICEYEQEAINANVYKEALKKGLSGDAHFLKQYDEILLLNDTVWGPVSSFQQLFETTQTYDVDFWGITQCYGDNHTPPYIDSGFIAVRKNMFLSESFILYWNKFPQLHTSDESFSLFESSFTSWFKAKGYHYKVFVDAEDLSPINGDPAKFSILELIKNRNCPVFYQRLFSKNYNDILENCCGQILPELYEYLNKNTKYNLDMLWEHLLRTENMYDIKQWLQLNYIIPEDTKKPSFKSGKKTALFMHIYSIDMVSICMQYAGYMPENADIYITTDTEEKRQIIDSNFSVFFQGRIKIILVQNRGRDVSALLIGLKDYIYQYDYICFIHDKKSDHNTKRSVGESFAYHCYKNIIPSPEFVQNVIDIFDIHPRLGLLVPPPPIHGSYYNIVGCEWQENYSKTIKLAKQWGITVDIDERKPPIAPLGTMFWFRRTALESIFQKDLKYEDFPEEPTGVNDGTIMHAIERLYPFIAQQSGYYTAWILNHEYAGLILTNLYKMVSDVNQILFKNYGQLTDRRQLIEQINQTKQQLELKCKYEKKLKRIIRFFLGDKNYESLWNVKERIKKRGNST